MPERKWKFPPREDVQNKPLGLIMTIVFIHLFALLGICARENLFPLKPIALCSYWLLPSSGDLPEELAGLPIETTQYRGFRDCERLNTAAVHSWSKQLTVKCEDAYSPKHCPYLSVTFIFTYRLW